MIFSMLADLVVVAHLVFVLFVVLGALLALRWPLVAWLHLPAAVWGAFIEFSGRVCPLTPLEVWLRRRAGGEGYAGGFIEHHLIPILYPADLTRDVQLLLGALVVLVNAGIYGWLWLHHQARRHHGGPCTSRRERDG
ncbi:MAG: DUF2784 domain-containing protein [Pseudomonadales bacterium]|jgi:hypothetical protein